MKEHQLQLLRSIVSVRCPVLLAQVEASNISSLSRDERRLIVEALGNEFAASGVAENSEPNRRGLQIEELLDIINYPNLGK